MDICFKEILNKTEDLFKKKKKRKREKRYPQYRIRLLNLYMGNAKAEKLIIIIKQNLMHLEEKLSF